MVNLFFVGKIYGKCPSVHCRTVELLYLTLQTVLGYFENKKKNKICDFIKGKESIPVACSVVDHVMLIS